MTEAFSFASPAAPMAVVDGTAEDWLGSEYAAVRDGSDFGGFSLPVTGPVRDVTTDERSRPGVLTTPEHGVHVDYEVGGAPGQVERWPYGVGAVSAWERQELRGQHVRIRRRPEGMGGPVTDTGGDLATQLSQQGLPEANDSWQAEWAAGGG